MCATPLAGFQHCKLPSNCLGVPVSLCIVLKKLCLQECAVHIADDYVVIHKPAGVQVAPTVDNLLENVLACTAKVPLPSLSTRCTRADISSMAKCFAMHNAAPFLYCIQVFKLPCSVLAHFHYTLLLLLLSVVACITYL